MQKAQVSNVLMSMHKAQVSNVLMSICNVHGMTYRHTVAYTNAAGVIPALVTRWIAYRDKTALADSEIPQKRKNRLFEEHTAFPNNTNSLTHALCLSATSHFWMSRSNAILGKASNVSVLLHLLQGFQTVSRAGTLHPLEPQRLAHLDCYFNLLQLIFFFFFFSLANNSSCCVGVHKSQMCTNSSFLNTINTLYTYIYLLWPEPAGPRASQKTDAIKGHLLLLKKCQCLALTGHITLFVLNITHSEQRSYKEPFPLQNINTLKPQ